MNFNLAELEVADIDPEGWPILTDSNGNLTEGTGYNVFLVSNGVIRTAGDRSILQGVSRGTVFDLAKQLNIPVVEEDLQPYDLYTADEAFFSGTSRPTNSTNRSATSPRVLRIRSASCGTSPLWRCTPLGMTLT